MYEINIETDRLRLRNIRPDDMDFLISLWTDPEVTKYMGGPRELKSLEEGIAESIADPYQYEYDLWVLCEKTTGDPIGHFGLLEKEVEGKNEIELIYVLAKKCWNNGFASEAVRSLIDFAFKTKKLRSLTALIKPGNTSSCNLALGAGFRFEKEIIRQENTRMMLYRIEDDS